MLRNNLFDEVWNHSLIFKTQYFYTPCRSFVVQSDSESTVTTSFVQRRTERIDTGNDLIKFVHPRSYVSLNISNSIYAYALQQFSMFKYYVSLVRSATVQTYLVHAYANTA